MGGKKKSTPIISCAFVLIVGFIFVVGSFFSSLGNSDTALALGFGATILIGIIIGCLFIGMIYLLVKEALRKRQLYDLQTIDRSTINNLSPVGLERLVGQIYQDLGYEVKVSEGRKDHGIDVSARKENKLIIVQCKKWNKPVGEPEIRDLHGVRHHVGATGAAMVSTSGFTQPAFNYARQNKIHLLGKEQLVDMVYKIRVRKEQIAKEQIISRGQNVK
jgi:hypothetical protein